MPQLAVPTDFTIGTAMVLLGIAIASKGSVCVAARVRSDPANSTDLILLAPLDRFECSGICDGDWNRGCATVGIAGVCGNSETAGSPKAGTVADKLSKSKHNDPIDASGSIPIVFRRTKIFIVIDW